MNILIAEPAAAPNRCHCYYLHIKNEQFHGFPIHTGFDFGGRDIRVTITRDGMSHGQTSRRSARLTPHIPATPYGRCSATPMRVT